MVLILSLIQLRGMPKPASHSFSYAKITDYFLIKEIFH